METADRGLLDQWMANWEDLVEFEIHPVMTSAEAAEKVAALRLRERAAGLRSPSSNTSAGCRKTTGAPAPAPVKPRQRLLQIRAQIVDVLIRRKTHQRIADTELLARLSRNGRVGHGWPVLDQALDAAELSASAKTARFQKTTRAGKVGAQGRRDHAAEAAAHLPPRQPVLRVRLESRVMHRATCGCACSQCASSSALAQCRCMRSASVLPAQGKTSCQRTRNCADRVLKEAQALAQGSQSRLPPTTAMLRSRPSGRSGTW